MILNIFWFLSLFALPTIKSDELGASFQLEYVLALLISMLGLIVFLRLWQISFVE